MWSTRTVAGQQVQVRAIAGGRRASLLVSAMAVMVLLMLMTTLALDVGRVQVAKSQLRAAADASALAAASQLLSDPWTASRVAIETAATNRANGKPVALESSDVVVGHWDAKARRFTPGSSAGAPNAVRVTAECSARRGNAVAPALAHLVGATSNDVRATAIAVARPNRYAIVGLDFVKMSGNSTDSYATRGNFTRGGSVASNGDITLGGSALVDGNAYPGIGHTVKGASRVTGDVVELARPLVYPQANPGDAATRNDNAALGRYVVDGVLTIGKQQTLALEGGTYYVKGLSVGAGGTLNVNGAATLYVDGDVVLSGHAATRTANPDDFKLVVLGTGRTVDLKGSMDLYADLYAPGAAVSFTGNSELFGAIVGQSVTAMGSGAVHYDRTLRGGSSLVE